MRHFPRRVKLLLVRNLLARNMLAAGLIFGVGDILEQVISGQLKHSWEMRKTAAFAGAGIVSTPTTYLLYRTLERINFRGTRHQIVMKKLFFDVCTNPFTTAYITIMAGVFEGRSFEEASSDWKFKFWEYFSLDIFVWPITNYINFYYLPFKFRLIYLNTVGLIYNMILANIRKERVEKAEVKKKVIE